MVEKNNNLVTIKSGNTDQSSLPVIVASMYGRKRMVHYLYSKTPKHLLDPNNPDPKYRLDGVLLLNNLITADFYDIASELLKLFPKLGIMADHHDNYALHKLAHKPSAFASGSKFPYWKQWIYNCVCIHSPWEVDTKINTPGDHQDEFISHPSSLHQLGWIMLRLIVPDIKHLHDRKLVNDEASNLLGCIFKEIKGMKLLELERLEIDKAVHNAIKHGIIEFVEELLTYNPEFIWRKDKRGRTTFSHAIVLRQENIFSLFYRLGTKKSIVASRHDIFQNNFLHLAAKLSPPAQLERVSGAALQMQRELQWYKEVESLVPPNNKDQVNESHRKPATLFTQENKDLAKEGEKWMKNTAGSSMIVGTLIAAVMFTTAFTVPGGNDEKSGLPIMLHTDSNVFMIFMISNGLSLFPSTTSVLMFLGILTARYAEDDFLVSLPTKLILGIACLFFPIVTMMISFATALYLELHKTLSWVSIPLILLSTFPVVLFSALQFPLLIEMVIRTYGSSIFDKHSKHASMIKKPQQYPPQQKNDDYSMKVEVIGDSSMNVCQHG
ncbi:putative PGG domain, ankyrin repeat-containing domain superfamily [Helianthus annuus]|nr:putative PGG domain, ankyrin repeat-containing domain superfamily [Helianthus annuus]